MSRAARGLGGFGHRGSLALALLRAGVWLCGVWGTLLPLPAAAADLSPADELAAVARERQAVRARHAEAVAACEQRFAVTACVNQAAAQRRKALDALRLREATVNDVQRRERAAARLARLHERQASAAVDAASATARQTPVRQTPDRRAERGGTAASTVAKSTRLPPASGRPPPPAPAPSARGPAPARSAAERRHDEAQARAAYDARQAAAAEHARSVEARNARHAARHAPAAGLPLPASGSAP